MKFKPFLFLLVLFTGCAAIGGHEVELAPYMGDLQRFSQKLGYSIQGKNKELSEFYLHELEEVLGEIKEDVPEQDGMPIAHSVEVIVDPLMEKLDAAVDKEDWPESLTAYSALVDGCNRCHSATEHEFIKITTPKGQAPFNQQF